MDFELSTDQVALRDAAVELLAGTAPIAVVRAAMDRGGAPDADLWDAMVDQGWCGIAAPESSGGVGLGWVEAAVLLEQVGAAVAPAPILGQLVAVDALAGTDLVGPLIRGDRVAAVGHRLDEPCVFAPVADVVVTVDGDALVVVELAANRPAAEPAMDLTRSLGWLHVDGLSRTELGGVEAVRRFTDVGAVAYSAELLGLAQAALDMSVAYAKERVQFGRPIGSFQAVKHRCADMLVDVEGMRSAVYWAAWCVSVDHEDSSVAASTAKSWCSDAATRVLSSALQVHGGIGFTWEHDLHLYLKRVHLDSLQFGDARWHRARLATMLRERVAAGQPVL